MGQPEAALDPRPSAHPTGLAGRAETLLRWIGASALLLMMLIVVADVLLRRLLRSPLVGAYEMVQVLMILFLFSTFPEATRRGTHIRIDLLTSRLPGPARRFLLVLTRLWGLVLFGLLAWRHGLKMVELWIRGDATMFLALPLAPLFAWIALCCALVTVVLTGQLVGDLHGLRRELSGPAAAFSLPGLFLGALLPIAAGTLMAGAPAARAGIVGIGLLLLLFAAGMPIAFALGSVGLLGISLLSGPQAGLAQLAMVPYGVGAEYILASIPLFILMGQLAGLSGMSRDLYEAGQRWLGHLPGGLAMATVAGCAAFASVSGSSIATTATLSAVVLPEMKKHGYDERLALGTVAAGGTLGILIPPSLVFILYGVLTEQSIGRLFMAGILPGLLSAGLYIGMIAVLVRIDPRLGPAAGRCSFRERIGALKRAWSPVGLFLLIVGGIYGGLFTPTEAAAVGACGTLLLVLLRGRFSFQRLSACLADTARNTAMLVLIFIGATLFNYFLALTRLPSELVGRVAASSISPALTLTAILLIYLALGCLMDSGSTIILTMPLVYPLILQCGFDPIWFGVIVVVMAEIGSITPPVGVNVFTAQASAPQIPLWRVFEGVLPFLAADLVRLVILVLIPAISLFLPDLLASSGP